MNRGKDPPRSLCEKKFVLEAIKENKRLDGRDVYDYRDLRITLGKLPGQVEVMLGRTRVLGHVTCQVIQPKPERPTEGQLFFNVELSPMASPAFEVGRPSSYAVEITRILERCLKESRAVDTESLCIIAGEKVWEIRVDLHVVDHCGNIIDCASVAAITALKYFRRPDVTVIGEEATIHTVDERDPVPLSVHHMPLCFTFAFFWEGEYLLMDPSLSEEAVMDARMIVGINVHREICALQMSGGVPILPEQVMRCTQIAATKCLDVTAAIKKALSEPQEQKVDVDSVLRTKKPKVEVAVPEMPTSKASESEEEEPMVVEESSKPPVTILGEGTAQLGMGGANTWEVLEQWNESDEEEDTLSKQALSKIATPSTSGNKERVSVKSKKQTSSNTTKKTTSSKAESDSEEEDVVVLTKEELVSGTSDGAKEFKARAGTTSLSDLTASKSNAGPTSLSDLVASKSNTGPTSLSDLVASESNAGATSLSDLIASELPRKKSPEVIEIADSPQPPVAQTSVETGSVNLKTKQRKGRGKKSGQQKSASPVEVESVDTASAASDGGKDKVAGNSTSSRTTSSKGRGKRRKSSTRTN